MKKLLMIVAVILALPTMAQLSQGKAYLTGTAGFNSTSSKFDNGTNTVEFPVTRNSTFGLGAAKMLTDQFAIVANVMFSSTVTDDKEINLKTVTRGASAGIGARRYSSITDGLYVFGELGIGYGSSYTETETSTNTFKGDKVSAFFTRLSPGITFFPGANEKVAFDVTFGALGFTSSKTEDRSDEPVEVVTSNTFSMGVDLTAITFGMQIFIK